VNYAAARVRGSYGRGMRTNDDIWLLEHEAWGADKLAWEDDEEPREEQEDEEPVREDLRY
jgi:hypothetical protein